MFGRPVGQPSELELGQIVDFPVGGQIEIVGQFAAHQDHSHPGGSSGLDAGWGVLDGDAFGRVDAQLLGCLEVNLR